MLTVRPALPADLHAVAELFNAYLGTGSMALEPLSADDYRPLLTDDRCRLLVAENGENASCVGYASVKPWSPRGGYVLAGEVSIFLLPGSTGSGTGTLLYGRLLPAAEALGYRYLAARIMARNTGSVRFHERHGFRVVGVQRGIGFINGERLDNVLMERVLP